MVKKFMNLYGKTAILIPLTCMTLLGTVGCTPMSEAEQEYLDKQRELEDEEGALKKGLESGSEMNAIIQKVKDFQRDDGLTNEEWLDRYMARHKQVASVVWDDWVPRKISKDKYEIKYLYTLLDAQYESEKHGLVWRVDDVIDRTIGPREMTPEELGSRGGKSGKSQADRTRTRERDSLE
jgi:hypothetical protein